MNKINSILVWLTIFSIAMGFLETAVVVYLRELYYPDGFNFPLAPIKPGIAVTEFLREAATMVMLAGIAVLTFKNTAQRFAAFIYAFAIWDIFYYVFLKLLLNWPASLLTWDILFLIPVPWVGPVVAPCLLSLTMIGLALFIMFGYAQGYSIRINKKEWMVFTLGSLVCILSFVWDYLLFVSQQGGLSSLWNLSSSQSLFTEALEYIPGSFNWMLFLAGEVILLMGIGMIIVRVRKQTPISIHKNLSPAHEPSGNFSDYFDAL
ncbi:hypothetical protein [Rhodocytophaga rosea]|uniref:hypothetical protein n=1 Tax=Rhodocytophaga rosea TaxID=2704465 RepID=UPI0018DA2C04|nr:hypothetical protein [Rhodocytophaga rosea]